MKTLIKIMLVLGPLAVGAQNELGLRTSNYSGINGVQLNPTAFAYSPLKWDLNIVSGGVFAYSDYMYVENTHLINLLGHNGPILFRSRSQDAQVADDPNALYYQYFDASRDMDNSFNAFVGLPSISFRINSWSFGVFANVRTAMSANHLDPDLDNRSLDQWPDSVTKIIDPFTMSGMVWSEIGVNVAAPLVKNRKGSLFLGGNIKYLMGYEGFYFNNKNRTAVMEVGDSLYLNGGPFEYGVATGQSTSGDGYNFQQNGSGLSVDIGATYIRKTQDGRPYHWRLGVSLLDIGYIRFNKNAQAHVLTEGTAYDIYKPAIDGDNIDAITSATSLEALNDATQSLRANEFSLLTPMALSIQFDYAINSNFFVNAVMNRRLSVVDKMVDRENFWSVSPRYENRWFEIGMPVVLHEDRNLRIGTFIRLAYLTIGSDHVNSLFIKQERFHGSDFYFALKFNPFDLGKNRSSGGRGGTSFEKCYF